MIKFLHDRAIEIGSNNCVTRQKCATSAELDKFDTFENISKKPILLPDGQKIKCYGCNSIVDRVHGNYVYSCETCGKIFEQGRYLRTAQIGKVAIVTGARTKLGHQIVLSLLRSGAFVIGTTRFVEKARQMYMQYPDYALWEIRLHLYSLDLDVDDLATEFKKMHEFVKKWTNRVDILINCAAQTIRHREKVTVGQSHTSETNRYGDDKYVDKSVVNSWNMLLPDIVQKEMEELFRINSIAPTLLVQTFLDMLLESDQAYVINVHAKEGLFNTHKTSKHMHSNMAKAALAMFTRCLARSRYRSKKTNAPFRVHGCDPGWISVDEYSLEQSPWITPPIDEIDGAARVLYPLWKERATNWRTRRHYERFAL